VNDRPWRRFGAVAAAATALVVSLTVAIPPSPASAASSASACTPLTLSEARDRILADVNAARSRAGERALHSNAEMNAVALAWSKKQADAENMSHNPNYASQIPAGWSAAGENVAYGYSPTQVTRAWLDSKGHRENILRTAFTHIGIGVACSDANRPYYTQVFGGYKTLRAGTPAIAGTAKAGVKLVAKAGTWTTGTTLRYQWYVDGKAVSGATATAYVPKTADTGKTVKVKVTGTKIGYSPTAKVSKPTPEVALPTLPSKAPYIKGIVKAGERIAVIRGTWATNVTYAYRWYRDGAAIAGATNQTYRLTDADRGKTIKAKVIGSKSGYTTASRVTASTAPVK
jgi:uncharacterized protein YkwD